MDRKELDKKYDAKRSGRTRNYATVVYPESAPAEWQQTLADSHVAAFVSPLHDKDTNPDGTHKKPHWHVLVMFSAVKTVEQARKFFEKIGGVGVEKVATLRGYARYLVHADNPEKYQYNVADVATFGGADYLSSIELPTDKYAIVAAMMDWCDETGCVEFSELMRYARHNEPAWFRALCDSSALVMEKYVKSIWWSQNSDSKKKPVLRQ